MCLKKGFQPYKIYKAASLHESLLKPSTPSTNRIEVRAAVSMLLAVAIALAGVAWIKPTAAIGLAWALSPATCSGEIRAAISVFLAIVIALATVAGIKPPAPKLLARSLRWRWRGGCFASLHRELVEHLSVIVKELSFQLLEVSGEGVKSEACNLLLPHGLYRWARKMILLHILICCLNHGPSTTGHISSCTVDGILIQQVGVTIEVQVKTVLGHWCDKIFHIHFVCRMMTNNDEPVLFWDFAQRLSEPFKLSSAVLCQDVLMKFAWPLCNRITGGELWSTRIPLGLIVAAVSWHAWWSIQENEGNVLIVAYCHALGKVPAIHHPVVENFWQLALSLDVVSIFMVPKNRVPRHLKGLCTVDIGKIISHLLVRSAGDSAVVEIVTGVHNKGGFVLLSSFCHLLSHGGHRRLMETTKVITAPVSQSQEGHWPIGSIGSPHSHSQPQVWQNSQRERHGTGARRGTKWHKNLPYN